MTQTRQISIDCRQASAPVTAVVAAIAVLALSGCSSLYNPSRESSIEYDPALLSGEAIFGEIVDSFWNDAGEECPDIGELATNPAWNELSSSAARLLQSLPTLVDLE